MENVQGRWKSSTTCYQNAWEMPTYDSCQRNIREEKKIVILDYMMELDDGRREKALWKKISWEEERRICERRSLGKKRRQAQENKMGVFHHAKPELGLN